MEGISIAIAVNSLEVFDAITGFIVSVCCRDLR